MKESYSSIYQIIGENIRQYREKSKWTQDDLANRCESVNRSKISKMENARVDYMLSTLLEVCNALGVDLNEITQQKK